MRERVSNRLGLHEEILLLGLRDKKGTVASSVWMDHALGGAILAELIIGGRVKVEAEGKKRFARVTNSNRMRDAVLGECLEKIRKASRRAQLQTWVSRFAAVKRLKQRVAEGLCHAGVLRAEEEKILLMFTRKIYPEVDPGPEREILERMRQAIFTRTDEIPPRTAVLVSLADSSGILPTVFDKKRLKKQKKRIAEIRDGDLTAAATRSAIEAVQAALLLTTVMPAVYSSATG